MAEQVNDNARYFVAGAAITAGQAVYIDAGDSYKVKPCDGPTRPVLGIACNTAEDDADVRVQLRGYATARAGGAIAPFAEVQSNADGEVVALAAGGIPIGRYIPDMTGSTDGFPSAADGEDIALDVYPSKATRNRAPISGETTEDLPSISAGAVDTVTVVALGAVVGDAVIPIPPATLNAGLVVTGLVTDDDEVTLTVTNATSGAINPGELVYGCLVYPAS